jgi:hypothetical protein
MVPPPQLPRLVPAVDLSQVVSSTNKADMQRRTSRSSVVQGQCLLSQVSKPLAC